MSCKIVNKKEGKVFLPNTGKESILFNKLINIVGVSNFDRALTIYNVTETKEYRDYKKKSIDQYRLDKSVVKNATPTKAGFSEVFNSDNTVKIVYKVEGSKVNLELIESKSKGKGLAKQFLQDFIYSFPNHDIVLTVAPRDSNTSFQRLAKFYQDMGFDFQSGSSFEMIRYKTKGRLYPEGFDINAEPSVKHLMDYINMQGKPKTTKKDVVAFMKSADISNSKDLLLGLSKAEKEGIFIFSKKSLENTKLFSTFEVSKIMKSVKQQESLTDMLKFLRQSSQEIEVDLVAKENTSEVSEYGKVETTSKEGSEIKTTVKGEVKPKKKRIKTDGAIITDFNSELAEDIAFVKLVGETDWDNMQPQIQTLLKEIEQEGLNHNINLKGLSTSLGALTRGQVIEILDEVENLLEGSKTTSEVIDLYLGEEVDTSEVILNENEVLFETEKSEQELFEQDNLLKISDGRYLKVSPESYIETLNTNSIKTERTIEQVEQDANLNYDKTISDIDVAKQIYLMKSNFEIVDEQSLEDIEKVSLFKEEVPSDFVEEFAQWLLKNDNSYFKVTKDGISFTNVFQAKEAMESLPNYLREDLNNYSITSKTITTPDLLSRVSVETGLLSEDRQKYLLSPKALPEFKGEFKSEGDTIIVKDNVNNFLRVGSNIFELSDSSGNISFFVKIESDIKNPNTINEIEYFPLMTEAKNTENLKVLTENQLEEINDKHYNC